MEHFCNNKNRIYFLPVDTKSKFCIFFNGGGHHLDNESLT